MSGTQTGEMKHTNGVTSVRRGNSNDDGSVADRDCTEAMENGDLDQIGPFGPC